MKAQYPEIENLLDDEIFIEGANMYKGEMFHEEISQVRLRRVIKRIDADALKRELKLSYNVNRINFITIEK
jgi:hypothetical protein